MFSRFSKSLHQKDQVGLLKSYYFPYREAIENKISYLIETGEKVVHLSVHSFTPVFKDKKRTADIGLLYDPQRASEKEFCKNLKYYLLQENAHLNIRFNYPYLGKADGFTTYLRKVFLTNYLGIELEINQEFTRNNSMDVWLKEIIHMAIINCLK